MGQPIHTVEMLDGSNNSLQDKLKVGLKAHVANAAGSGAGVAVTVAVSFGANANLPANYTVSVDPGQDATWYTSAKTATGFTVNLLPRLAANTLAAGFIDVAVFA